ncbi:MAG: hypothetical protein GX808_05735 [Syntrophomonadaceae bacterium]|jgi:uncharacterized protein (TIGR02145 family)|nr:FISUMP domain-containing protein [Bacteroidales bacterium]MDD3962665.1 FISUMP domain-containing protein [Bacteroidales bacterium]NLB52422.1 hypothetical protein [Syntrophomonadaceae bacterium]
MKKIIISLFALVFIYSFTPQDAPNTFTDSRDGKVYKTVTIGEQTWMAENLAYLPSVVGPATGSNTEPYYYVYGYDSTDVATAKATENFQIYGVLYNWPAAMNGVASSDTDPSGIQGVCPDGWHLPSDAEWTQLETFLANNGHNYDGSTGGSDRFGVRDKIAISMATERGWKSHRNAGAIGNTEFAEYKNKSGFSALPGGYRYNVGEFFFLIGYDGHWWCSTERDTGSAWSRYLYFHHSYMDRYNNNKELGCSVRCIKD